MECDLTLEFLRQSVLASTSIERTIASCSIDDSSTLDNFSNFIRTFILNCKYALFFFFLFFLLISGF